MVQRRKKAKPPASPDVSNGELARHVQNLHGVPASFVEAVAVKEVHDGKTVWEGTVRVYELTKHPSGAALAYAWSYPLPNGKRQFIAVLGLSAVTSASKAVQAVILAMVKEAEKLKN